MEENKKQIWAYLSMKKGTYDNFMRMEQFFIVMIVR